MTIRRKSPEITWAEHGKYILEIIDFWVFGENARAQITLLEVPHAAEPGRHLDLHIAIPSQQNVSTEYVLYGPSINSWAAAFASLPLDLLSLLMYERACYIVRLRLQCEQAHLHLRNKEWVRNSTLPSPIKLRINRSSVIAKHEKQGNEEEVDALITSFICAYYLRYNNNMKKIALRYLRG